MFALDRVVPWGRSYDEYCRMFALTEDAHRALSMAFERHEVDNTGSELLKTLNFYYPPAFDADGDPMGPGKQ